VRVIVVDISNTQPSFEYFDSLNCILDTGGVEIADVLNIILSHHEKHGFTAEKMICCDSLVQKVFNYLMYEYPTFMNEVPFGISDQVKIKLEDICTAFTTTLTTCHLKGMGWGVVGYRSAYVPILGKVMQ
jgi:hypothetical protein